MPPAIATSTVQTKTNRTSLLIAPTAQAPFALAKRQSPRHPRGGARYAPTPWLFQGGCGGCAVEPRKSPGWQMRPIRGKHCDGGRCPVDCSMRIRQPDASSGGVATHTRMTGKVLAAAIVATPGNADRMNKKPSVFADATSITEPSDAAMSNAPGFPLDNFFPYSTAPPAALTVAAAARLGVLPECQSACSSTPPTPRKPGL